MEVKLIPLTSYLQVQEGDLLPNMGVDGRYFTGMVQRVLNNPFLARADSIIYTRVSGSNGLDNIILFRLGTESLEILAGKNVYEQSQPKCTDDPSPELHTMTGIV